MRILVVLLIVFILCLVSDDRQNTKRKTDIIIEKKSYVTTNSFDDEQLIKNLKEHQIELFREKARMAQIEYQREQLEIQRQQQIAAKQNALIDVVLINQMPQLPRGCEVTSLSMLLISAGLNVDKMTLAQQVTKVPFIQNGLHGNPNDGFVGNMYTFKEPGLGVYHGPIAQLAKQYLGNRIVDLSGQSFDVVINQLKNNKPVWVIVNVRYSFLPQNYWLTWNTKEGNINITYQEHSVLVTGFDANYIYFNDPLAGIKNRQINRDSFIDAWQQIGSQAISYN